MYKVLTQEAVQDPTAIEMKVQEEMAQRQRNHEKRNEDRKLTKEQKRAKKLRKMFEDTSLFSFAALFKVKCLIDNKHRWKIEVNAIQNFLTGVGVLYKGCNMILVEGGQKGIKRFKKLMLSRIEWNTYLEPEEGDLETRPLDNECHMVWEGTVLRPAFRNFRYETCNTEATAKKFLKERSIGHYWDCVRWFKPDADLPKLTV